MKSHPILLICLGLALSPAALVQAQTDIPIQYALRESVWTVSAGLRARSTGADVRFGQLGTVSTTRTADPIGAPSATRVYDTGTVELDSPRQLERDADGNVVSTPGGRFQYFIENEEGESILVADILSHTPGWTRSWRYASPDQLTGDGRMAMSNFSSTSEGATAVGNQTASGGIEVGLARRLGRISPRTEWGIGLSVGLTDINSSTRSTIQATLNTLTDFYSLNGQTPPAAPNGGPTFIDLLDDEGNLVTPSGFETTVPISQDPLSRTETSQAGAAEVDGYWQIKGAYYMMRFGPNFRGHLSDKFALFASAGFAGAYVGTQYRADETLMTDLPIAEISSRETSDDRNFMVGFYAELAAEYWITPRTGLYASATYESLGEYSQTLQDRTATIDLGKGTVFRFGLVTRF